MYAALRKCRSSLNAPSWRNSGAAPSMATLATTPARYSLTPDVVFKIVARLF